MMSMNPTPWHKKLKYSTIGALVAASVALSPVAYALMAVVNPADLAAMTAAMQKIETEIRQKFEKELQERLAKEANKITGDLQGKLNNAISGEVNKITNGQIGKLMQNAGINLSNIDGAPGKVNTTKIGQQVKSLAGIDNIAGQVAAQTQIMLQNQLNDRLNVTSMLDEKPASGDCVSPSAKGDKCTILTRLREMDAMALNDLQRQNIAALGLQVAMKGPWATNVLANAYKSAGTSIKGAPDIQLLISFLTPSHSIPLGYERNENSTLNLSKAMWLSNVMIGAKNDVQFLTSTLSNRDEKQQLDAMSKIAKTQLARSAMMNMNNESTQAAMNAQFRACVVRPDAQDRIGATQEQQLVHLQSLQRCTNMILLQSRQQSMEELRIQGAILSTLLDLYAVQQPAK